MEASYASSAARTRAEMSSEPVRERQRRGMGDPTTEGTSGTEARTTIAVAAERPVVSKGGFM